MKLFVTLEGPEGSGKTTVAQLVYDYFKDLKQGVMLTREPGGIPISEKIRDIILDPENNTMDDRTEALLYAASRRQHLTEKVLPALDRGALVICDRFIDSSLAYQGFARGLGIDNVLKINRFAIDNHMPDLTLYLDVPFEVGMDRIGVRGYKDRLELAGDDFHYKVFQGYQEVWARYPERIVRIDAQQSPEEVAQAVIREIEKKLNASL